MSNDKRFKSLLNNRYQFCPLCSKYTIQQKVLNKYNEFYCVSCGNIFKKTEPLVPEYDDELDLAVRDEMPVSNEFEGWEVDELKDEVYRLQDILDKHRIKY